MAIIRVRPASEEMYGSTILRMALINAVTPEEILKNKGISFSNAALIRDAGQQIDRYCAYFNDEKMKEVICQTATLRGYYLGQYSNQLNGKNANSASGFVRGLRQGAILRLCPACYVEDYKRYGLALWHLPHQLPVTHVCRGHKELLLDVKMADKFRLPCSTDCQKILESNTHFDLLARIADAEHAVFQSRISNQKFSKVVESVRLVIRQRYQYNVCGLMSQYISDRLSSLCTIGIFKTVLLQPRLSLAIEGVLNEPENQVDPTIVAILISVGN